MLMTTYDPSKSSATSSRPSVSDGFIFSQVSGSLQILSMKEKDGRIIRFQAQRCGKDSITEYLVILLSRLVL